MTKPAIPEDLKDDYAYTCMDAGHPWSSEFVRELIERISHLDAEKRLLKGAMDAQDERERLAGVIAGVPYESYGCDWPDAVADKICSLEAEKREAERKGWNEAVSLAVETLVDGGSSLSVRALAKPEPVE